MLYCYRIVITPYQYTYILMLNQFALIYRYRLPRENTDGAEGQLSFRCGMITAWIRCSFKPNSYSCGQLSIERYMSYMDE